MMIDSFVVDVALRQTIQVSLLAAFVWLLVRLSATDRPHLAHALWAIVLLKCVIPPLIASPVSPFSWLSDSHRHAPPATGTGRPASDHNAEYSTRSKRSAMQMDRPPGTSFADQSPFLTAPTGVAPESDSDSASKLGSRDEVGEWMNGLNGFALAIAIIWSVVSGLSITWTTFRLFHFLRRVNRSQTVVSSAVQTALHALTERLKIQRRIDVRVVDVEIGPAVVGLFRPTILLPKSIVMGRAATDLELLLAHELIHIRRGDLWWGLLQTVATAVWWFHPLVRLACKAMNRESERSCDEETVALLNCPPATYARTLLDVLERKHLLRVAPALPGVRPVDITAKRMERIMRLGKGSHQRRPWWVAVIFSIGMAIALPGAAWDAGQESESTKTTNGSPHSRAGDGVLTAATPAPQPQTKGEESFPTELARVSLPDYVLEPPDIVSIGCTSLISKEGQQIDASDLQHIVGQHLIGPDGKLTFGRFGAVQVSGKTLPQAREVVEEALSEFFHNPCVSLDVFAYNSKVYYIVIERAAKQGDQVTRVPVTGNETVLDAIAQIGGLESKSLRRIWVSRPCKGEHQILPVDFAAITRKGATETNYQMLPGDRLFISSNMPEGWKPVTIDDVVDEFNKLVAAERINDAITLIRDAAAEHAHSPVLQSLQMHANLLEENLVYRAQSRDEAMATFIEELRNSGARQVAIQRALGRLIRAQFKDIELKTVVKALGTQSGIDIVLDLEGLADQGVSPETTVTLELDQEVSLRNALQIMLEPRGLVSDIRFGVLRITSAQRIDPVFVQTYVVADLLGLPTRIPGNDKLSPIDYDSLIELVTSAVSPDIWGTEGPGKIQAFEPSGSLVVSCSGSVHHEIERLMQQLRKLANDNGNGVPLPYSHPKPGRTAK